MAEVTGGLTAAASIRTASQTERAVADAGSAQALAYEADGSMSSASRVLAAVSAVRAA